MELFDKNPIYSPVVETNYYDNYSRAYQKSDFNKLSKTELNGILKSLDKEEKDILSEMSGMNGIRGSKVPDYLMKEQLQNIARTRETVSKIIADMDSTKKQ